MREETKKLGKDGLPRLPPLPRKRNRTIYIANDELWNRAKTLAGAEGLSAVIARALADFVAARTNPDETFEKFRFEILGLHDSAGPTEVIGFEGKELLSGSFDLEESPLGDSAWGDKAFIKVYRTRLGKFVVLAAPAPDLPESESAYALYEGHKSVTEVMRGGIVSCMFPPARHEFLKKLTANLGKDGVTWID